MPETKIAPTDAKSREQHEALVAANKKLIDETTSKPGGSQRREMVLPLSAGDMRLAGDRAGAL
jgi:hypothetical protein